jgi:citrate lyase subunit gamma (acyl carrier protein)
MEIVERAMAGTLESGDIMIVIDKGNKGIDIELNSIVEKQFGEQIRGVILETLKSIGVKSARVSANDRGALDCTIKARTMAACYRAIKSTDYKWGE